MNFNINNDNNNNPNKRPRPEPPGGQSSSSPYPSEIYRPCGACRYVGNVCEEENCPGARYFPPDCKDENFLKCNHIMNNVHFTKQKILFLAYAFCYEMKAQNFSDEIRSRIVDTFYYDLTEPNSRTLDILDRVLNYNLEPRISQSRAQQPHIPRRTRSSNVGRPNTNANRSSSGVNIGQANTNNLGGSSGSGSGVNLGQAPRSSSINPGQAITTPGIGGVGQPSFVLPDPVAAASNVAGVGLPDSLAASISHYNNLLSAHAVPVVLPTREQLSMASSSLDQYYYQMQYPPIPIQTLPRGMQFNQANINNNPPSRPRPPPAVASNVRPAVASNVRPTNTTSTSNKSLILADDEPSLQTELTLAPRQDVIQIGSSSYSTQTSDSNLNEEPGQANINSRPVVESTNNTSTSSNTNPIGHDDDPLPRTEFSLAPLQQDVLHIGSPSHSTQTCDSNLNEADKPGQSNDAPQDPQA